MDMNFEDAETALKSTVRERRERFRTFMQAFNPAAPPSEAIRLGFVLESLHGDFHKRVAVRADLEPGCSQLVVGGIGSGKTTELILATRALKELTDSLTLLIDITRETDLSSLAPGSLIASFGIHLSQATTHSEAYDHLEPEEKNAASRAVSAIRDFAYGKTEYHWVPDDGEDDSSYYQDDDDSNSGGYYESKKIAGKLSPPMPALHRDIDGIRPHLEFLLTIYKENGQDVVVLFDGLDRLITPQRFWAVADQDLRLLKQLAISVICTGPVSLLFSRIKVPAEHFDRVRHISAVPSSRFELREVFARRHGEVLLSDKQVDVLCDKSGGLLRDLIALARDAAEEAYISRSDTVRDVDLNLVIHQLGESYLRGLGQKQERLLRKYIKGEGADFGDEKVLELLATRRLIEYSPTDLQVHPALVSVMESSNVLPA